MPATQVPNRVLLVLDIKEIPELFDRQMFQVLLLLFLVILKNVILQQVIVHA
jgi:hypothetical protein